MQNLVSDSLEKKDGKIITQSVKKACDINGYRHWKNLRKEILVDDSMTVELNSFRWDLNSSTATSWKKIEFTQRRSIMEAYSFAKEFVKEIDPFNNFFNQSEVICITKLFNHTFTVNTGPSAGRVFATILISLALQKPVCQDLAMTGQITSEGKIRKIGGVR